MTVASMVVRKVETTADLKAAQKDKTTDVTMAGKMASISVVMMASKKVAK